MVAEEWGLIIALLLVASVIAMAVFSVRVIRNGRSAYYTTAACATACLLVFQTALNVLGSVDILPLTGVTFPFLSNGGSSMISCWSLLAFIKAADTRQEASFAVRAKSRTMPPPQMQETQRNLATEEGMILPDEPLDEISAAFDHFDPMEFDGPQLPPLPWDTETERPEHQDVTANEMERMEEHTAVGKDEVES